MALIACIAVLLAFAFGRQHGYRLGFRRNQSKAYVDGHSAGQLQMKEQVRREINDNLAKGNFVVRFRDGFDLSAEQMLQFMCHGQLPDPNDATRGVATYQPN